MSNLPQSGVSLVAQGASAYIGDIGKAAKATDDFANGLSGAGGKASGFGEVVTGALRQVGVIAVEALGQAAQAVAGFMADSVKSAANVEQTLAVIGATSGATDAQLEQLRTTAIALGGDLTLPATSAQDATKAMLELTKAGFSVDEAMAAAKGTLQLAAAEIDAGEAAAITAQMINAFNLEASDAAHIADLLAGGANASSASITDLSQGTQQAGFAFDAAGQSAEDLVVSLAALTNVGLTGSDAGTALKNAMMRLMNPTDKAQGLMKELGINAYDANGKMKPWPEVLENIRVATKGMTDEQRNAALGTIFLSDGMKAMIPLLDMTDAEYQKLTADVTKQGSAQAVAAAQTQGFNGAIAGLQSQMETLQLIIGTRLLPLLTPLIQAFSQGASQVATFVDTFLKLAPAISESADPITTFFNILRISTDDTWNPLIASIQEFVGEVQSIAPVVMSVIETARPYFEMLLTTATTAFEGIQAMIASVMPFILAVVSSVLGQVLTFWENNGMSIMMFVMGTWMQVNAIITSALELISKIIQGVLATILLFIEEHGDTIQAVLTQAWNIIRSVITAALAIIQGVIKAALAIMDGDWETAWTAIKEMTATVLKAIGSVILAALEIIARLMGTSLDELDALWNSNFKKIGDAVAPYMKIAQDAVTGAIESIKGAFGGIAGAIQGAIDAVKKFIDAASKIKVPSLITPGSPTPLEIGMTGIADATKQAAAAFTAQLSPALNMVAMPAKAVMGATTNNNQRSSTYNMPVYTNQSPSVVRQSLALVEAMSL